MLMETSEQMNHILSTSQQEFFTMAGLESISSDRLGSESKHEDYVGLSDSLIAEAFLLYLYSMLTCGICWMFRVVASIVVFIVE